MTKLNCWEYLKCGREPNGKKTKELGVCLAAIDKEYDEINGGKNGGRFCWSITGTLCENGVQGTFAQKQSTCMNCDFYKRVKKEEGEDLVMLKKYK